MNELNHYLEQVRKLVDSVSSELTDSEQKEVSYLIDHDECGEALRTLAWIVVEENKKIPTSAVKAIKDLSEGLVAEEDFPPGFDNYLADSNLDSE